MAQPAQAAQTFPKPSSSSSRKKGKAKSKRSKKGLGAPSNVDRMRHKRQLKKQQGFKAKVLKV